MLARKKNVTLSDVAGAVGVSRALAGKVLGGGGNSNIRVSEETARMIREAAQRLHYRPNLSARMLTGQSSRLIGILIDAQPPAVTFRTLAFIDKYAAENGYRLLIAEAHANAEKQLLNYRTLLQYGVDGVICHANSVHESLQQEKNVVLYGAEPFDGIPSVYYDIEAGYREALAQFEAEGRKFPALALFSETRHDSVRARHRAFRHLEKKFSGGLHILEKRENASGDDFRPVVEQLVEQKILPQKIDALILQNDQLALALLFELQRRGIRVPEEIALVGQDNSAFCCCARPALSTIDSNLDGLGNAVMELMLERLEHPKRSIRSIGVSTWLVKRETTLAFKNKES